MTPYTIRDATYEDKAGILALSKLIWEGEDYLPSVIDLWLGSDQPLIVAEETPSGRIIGLDRVSISGKHAFFQGLRVHPEREGQGIAKALAKEITIRALKKGGSVFWAGVWHENHASLSLSKRVGMRPIATMYLLSYPLEERSEESSAFPPEDWTLRQYHPQAYDETSRLFHETLQYTAGAIPMGWSCIPDLFNAHDRWILESKEGSILLGMEDDNQHPSSIVLSLMTKPGPWTRSSLKYIQQMARENGWSSIYIPVPVELRGWAEELIQMGAQSLFDDMPWDECKVHYLRGLPESRDQQIAAFQLGKKELTNFSHTVHRCPYGFPQVVESEPQKSGQPFPTLFYLTCPHLRREIAHMEERGLVSRWDALISNDPEWKARMDKAHSNYQIYRDRKILCALSLNADQKKALRSALSGKGIGGIDQPGGTKCLHLHLATYLGGLKDPIGSETFHIMVQEKKPMCCSDADCSSFFFIPNPLTQK